jgi:hypothetical protein
VLVDLRDLRLYGWQRLGGFLVFKVVHISNLYKVLLITHCWAAQALPLPPPPHSPDAHTPPGPKQCHIEKLPMALLVYY